MPGEFQLLGVKRRGVDEQGHEFFETCNHDSLEATGWTVSYDGTVFCGVTFDSPAKVQAVIETMMKMFNAGVRHNQFKVKQVLGWIE